MQTRRHKTHFSHSVISTSGGLMLISNPMFDYYPTHRTTYFRPMTELLRDQRQGKFLTFEEKNHIKKEAEANRKRNLQKRK